MLTTALSALALGALSSLHCVGMCGPLLLALNPHPLLYHTGRISTYAGAGLLFGLLGRHLYLAGWQQALSISLGSLILLSFPVRHRNPLAKLTQPLLRWMTRGWKSPSAPTFFVMGMANGLLPCGMVYLALAGALTRTSASEAALFMTLFGIGTLPLLIATQQLRRRITPKGREHFRRLLPIITVGMGLLLILRGLNLGIPFVSPHLASTPSQAISCH